MPFLIKLKNLSAYFFMFRAPLNVKFTSSCASTRGYQNCEKVILAKMGPQVLLASPPSPTHVSTGLQKLRNWRLLTRHAIGSQNFASKFFSSQNLKNSFRYHEKKIGLLVIQQKLLFHVIFRRQNWDRVMGRGWGGNKHESKIVEQSRNSRPYRFLKFYQNRLWQNVEKKFFSTVSGFCRRKKFIGSYVSRSIKKNFQLY